MARRHFSGDPLGEQKIALERLIKKTTDALDGARGVGINEAGNGSTAPVFATGFSGTETVVIAMWDFSLWDGEDVRSD